MARAPDHEDGTSVGRLPVVEALLDDHGGVRAGILATLVDAIGGGLAGFGAPRYGTRSAEGVLVVDADERAAIERAVILRASGASLRTIAQTLTDEGYQPRRTRTWHPETLRRLLARAA